MNDDSMSNSNGRFFLALVAPILFPLIGIFIGVGFNHGLFVLGNNPRWRRIPDPPSPPIELVDAAPGCVYIQSADENNYFFCENNGNENVSWEIFDEVELNGARIPCSKTMFPDPPGDALQIVEFCLGKEYIDNTQFALFEDGSIKFRRIQGNGWGSLYRGLIIILVGGILGLISGIGMFIFRRKQIAEESI